MRRGSLLLGGLIIGISFLLFGIPSQEFEHTAIYFSLFFLVAGIVVIRRYKSYGNMCPNCYNKELMSIDDVKAADMIKNNRCNSKVSNIHICTNCNYQNVQDKKQSLSGSIVITFIGLFTLVISLFVSTVTESTLSILALFLGPLIIIITGINGLSSNMSKKSRCPSCNKKSFIPITSKQAQSIINQDQTKAPTT